MASCYYSYSQSNFVSKSSESKNIIKELPTKTGAFDSTSYKLTKPLRSTSKLFNDKIEKKRALIVDQIRQPLLHLADIIPLKIVVYNLAPFIDQRIMGQTVNFK